MEVAVSHITMSLPLRLNPLRRCAHGQEVHLTARWTNIKRYPESGIKGGEIKKQPLKVAFSPGWRV
jgi:hypothetical protein